jgi:hypothetical protein
VLQRLFDPVPMVTGPCKRSRHRQAAPASKMYELVRVS